MYRSLRLTSLFTFALMAISLSAFSAASVNIFTSDCAAGSNYFEFRFNITNTSTAGEVLYINAPGPWRITHGTAIVPAGTNTYSLTYVPGTADSIFTPCYAVLANTYNLNYSPTTRLMQSTYSNIVLGNSGDPINAPVNPGQTVSSGIFRLTITNTDWVPNQPISLAWSGTTSGIVAYVNTNTTVTSFNQAANRTLGALCSATTPLPCAVAATASATDLTCYGAGDGTAAVAAIGTPPFTYLWNNGATVSSLSGLNPGTYSVVVTGAGGCTSTAAVTITQPSRIQASSFSGTIVCAGDSALVTVSATGGTTPYTGAGVFREPAGTHAYTVTDANGCTATTSVTINQPPALVVSATSNGIRCYGDSATVIVAATGGTAPYAGTGSYKLPQGSYTFVVTDANGCTQPASISITQPTSLNAAATAGTIACNGGTTTVNVSASGGTAPYTGVGLFTAGAGTQTYTVTDAHGCTTTTGVTITQPAGFTVTATAGTIACNGGTTTVTVTASGGNPPYNGTGTFTAAAGTSSYTVTDSRGCPSTTSITIIQPVGFTVNAAPGIISCNGGSTTLTITATGGVPPYTGTGTFTRSAGAYSYTVTDSTGCSAIANGTISQPQVLTTASSGAVILCYGDSANVLISAIGGTAPYTGTGTYRLAVGSYSYTVTDSRSCTAIQQVTLTQPAGLVAASAVSGTIVCNGGTVVVSVTATGGTAPYFGGGPFTVGAGVHPYTVTDANGCTSTTIVSLTEPSALTAMATGSAVNCHSDSTLVAVTASGGTSPYSGTGNFYQAAGSRSYTISDANGCTASTTGTVSVNPIVVSFDTANCQLSTAAIGSYQWHQDGQPVTGASNQQFDLSVGGTYYVVVTFANGCSDTSAYPYVTVSNLAACIMSESPGSLGGIVFDFHPNPAVDQLVIQPVVTGKFTVEVRTIDGRFVKQVLESERSGIPAYNVDISALAAGIYLLRFISAEGVVSKRLVVSR